MYHRLKANKIDEMHILTFIKNKILTIIKTKHAILKDCL